MDRRLGPVLALLVLALAGGAAADQPPVLECPWYSTTLGVDESFGQRGFYIRSYRATSLKQVTLYIAFPAPGAYSLRLVARGNGFGATYPLRGQATVNLNVASGALGYQVRHVRLRDFAGACRLGADV